MLYFAGLANGSLPLKGIALKTRRAARWLVIQLPATWLQFRLTSREDMFEADKIRTVAIRSVQNRKGPRNYMVYTCALKGFLYPYLGVYVCTTMALGPFGEYCIERSRRESHMAAYRDLFKPTQRPCLAGDWSFQGSAGPLVGFNSNLYEANSQHPPMYLH